MCSLLLGQVRSCLHLVSKITPIVVYHPFLKGQRCCWLSCLVSNAPNQQYLICLTFRSDDVRVFARLQMGVPLIHLPVTVEMHGCHRLRSLVESSA